MGLFSCCCLGWKQTLSTSYVDGDTISLDTKPPSPTTTPTIISAIPSHSYTLSRIRTPPLSQHPAFRNAPDAPIHTSSSSCKRPRQPLPELAHLVNASPPSQSSIGEYTIRRPEASSESLFGWDTPCAAMLPPGHKIVLSKSRNHLRHAARGPESPLNGFRQELVSIGEVVERGEYGEVAAC